jgi:hypothetical protein
MIHCIRRFQISIILDKLGVKKHKKREEFNVCLRFFQWLLREMISQLLGAKHCS